MTKREKEEFCASAAFLLAPPDERLVEAVRKGVVPCAREAFDRPRGEDFADDFLPILKDEYERLFAGGEGERISLVESTYKPWTRDPACGLAFAGSRGLLMGDSALHMAEIFRRLSIEVPEEFRSTPDHLILELELLSLLYRSGEEAYSRRFIEDHLDWVGDLKDRVTGATPHPFYLRAIETIHLFLLSEKKNGKDLNHGSKNLC